MCITHTSTLQCRSMICLCTRSLLWLWYTYNYRCMHDTYNTAIAQAYYSGAWISSPYVIESVSTNIYCTYTIFYARILQRCRHPLCSRSARVFRAHNIPIIAHHHPPPNSGVVCVCIQYCFKRRAWQSILLVFSHRPCMTFTRRCISKACTPQNVCIHSTWCGSFIYYMNRSLFVYHIPAAYKYVHSIYTVL